MHKIVIIDDEKMACVMAKGFLSRDYDVQTYNSGAEGLQALNAMPDPPSVILLDVTMPDMDGFEVMRKLQASSWLNRIPVIFLTSDRSEKTELACFKMGAVDYICKPFVPTIMLQRIYRTITLEEYSKRLEQMVAQQLSRLTQIQNDVIVSMGNLIESRDGTTGEHVRRTSEYVKFLANEMVSCNVYKRELTPHFIDLMYRAAPLHDIGKITIPDRILQKQGKLTPEEYELIKTHAAKGSEIIEKNMANLQDLEFMNVAKDMARHHHEKWNGTGYPDGLKGAEIPLSARIIAVADVFDALVSQRSYKQTMSIDDAFNIMRSDERIAFEPVILQIFLSARDRLYLLMKRFVHA